jgi:predicted molibdopterin-dependent oxidoreductase YjgC
MLYEGGLKALYIMGENPVVTFPNSARVEEVLKSLELLVVQDIMLTPTAELAHVVLPASSWSEKEGTFIGATGLAQRFPQCLPETGLSVADWKILRNLGRMMQAEMGAKDMESLRGEMGSLLEPIAQAPECPPRRLLPVRQELLQEPDAQYPFLLSTGVLMQHSGSLTTISKHLGSVVSDAYLQINPQDAKALGIQEEGFVKLTGRAGTSVFIKAKVTDEVPQGMVFAPAHFPHARVSLLTELSTDHQSPTVAVRIEAA